MEIDHDTIYYCMGMVARRNARKVVGFIRNFVHRRLSIDCLPLNVICVAICVGWKAVKFGAGRRGGAEEVYSILLGPGCPPGGHAQGMVWDRPSKSSMGHGRPLGFAVRLDRIEPPA